MSTPRRLIALAILLLGISPLGVSNAISATDEIDLMLQRGQVPPDMRRTHGYSDFTDPLGRFLDLLAAGSIVEAKSIQPDACAFWLATRQASAFSGKVWVWNTEINLDTLCTQR